MFTLRLHNEKPIERLCTALEIVKYIAASRARQLKITIKENPNAQKLTLTLT